MAWVKVYFYIVLLAVANAYNKYLYINIGAHAQQSDDNIFQLCTLGPQDLLFISDK